MDRKQDEKVKHKLKKKREALVKLENLREGDNCINSDCKGRLYFRVASD